MPSEQTGAICAHLWAYKGTHTLQDHERPGVVLVGQYEEFYCQHNPAHRMYHPEPARMLAEARQRQPGTDGPPAGGLRA